MAKNFVRFKGDSLILFHDESPIEQNWEQLQPGMYIFRRVITGPFQPDKLGFAPLPLQDSLIRFKNGVVSDVLNKTDRFFSEETTQAYKDLEIAQKMGMILYGPPGTGKTCTAQLIMKELAERFHAVTIDFTGHNLDWVKAACRIIRRYQSSPLVIFMDEVERPLNDFEDEFLTFLDGNDSIPNSIFLGCTNFYSRIPRRIRERRSRIRYSFEIKSLPEKVYEEYVMKKVPKIPETDLKAFVYYSVENQLTIDELKHAVIDYHVDKVEVKEAIKGVKQYAKSEEDDDGF